MVVISSQPNNQDLFRRRKPTGLSLCFALVFSLGLVFADVQGAYTDKVKTLLAYVTSPMQYAVDWPVRMIAWLTTSVSSRSQLLDENMQLRYQQMMLQAQLQKMLALQNENAQLRQLLKSAKHNQSKVIGAQILAVDTNQFNHVVLVDRGVKDALYIGQPVFDAHGLMGQVIAVGPITSTVLLISDTKSGIPVQNNRTGERSIVRGEGSLNTMSLMNLPNTSDTKQGDLLVTSGLAGHFPEGYPVAQVANVTTNAGESFMQIQVHPVAELNRSRLVLLSWPTAKEKLLAQSIEKARMK